ncbi:carboxymuconolactone decarboxylase family protein [Kushneria phosphatilytica]|uniref:Carboxymuconolactone decarboxylase family protein n=1 Tax=Kushneria phosphatilytica TaxID=657387 RepID=A0A1S1NU22_9GAMM|nr:carboxymuconolactone decarboxylase family protein [Kushneria phosphatilytica]OHV08929.1 hypothetical protein BH688_13100 [Kushneria phosphatilytica]QEL09679.1 carboxymuconolactone decarboxylase family protein [Kushneria phosphatilytica]
MATARDARIDLHEVYYNTRSIRTCSLDPSIRCLAELRASQINGCENCQHLRIAEAIDMGVSREKIDALADWSASDKYSERERAALAWCEAFTHFRPRDNQSRLLAIRQFSPRELADLTLAIELTGTLDRVSDRVVNDA